MKEEGVEKRVSQWKKESVRIELVEKQSMEKESMEKRVSGIRVGGKKNQ